MCCWRHPHWAGESSLWTERCEVIASTALAVEKALGADHTVVVSPDHPALLSGPELLVGGRGRLTGVFWVRSATRRRLLESRVIATRLALPPNARIIAIADSPSPVLSSLLSMSFDEVVEERNTRELIRICKSKYTTELRDLREIQRRHAIFYSTLLQVATLRRNHDLVSVSPRSVLADLEKKTTAADRFIGIETDIQSVDAGLRGKRGRSRPSYHKHRVWLKQAVVAGLTLSINRPMLPHLRAYWTEGLTENFRLDGGVPYPSSLWPRFLLIQRWPRQIHDPDKPVRAIAFSGWVMAIATNVIDVEKLVERTEEVTERRLRA